MGRASRSVRPHDNEADLREPPDNVRESMRFTLADTLEDALGVTLPGLVRRVAMAS